MANYLGNTLNRIIREIAYTKGELQIQTDAADKASRQLRTVAIEFMAARAAVRRANARLAELEKQLGEKIDLRTDDIRAIRHYPKLPNMRYGKVIRELVAYLQSSAVPIKTSDIVEHLTTSLGIPYETVKERAYADNSIGKRLRKLVKHGVVARYPETFVCDGSSPAYWHWVGTGSIDSGALE